MKQEDIIRARFLMSPYNVREAKRARDFRNAVVGISLTVVLFLIGAGIVALVQR
jgi:hypothetical protein